MAGKVPVHPVISFLTVGPLVGFSSLILWWVRTLNEFEVQGQFTFQLYLI